MVTCRSMESFFVWFHLVTLFEMSTLLFYYGALVCLYIPAQAGVHLGFILDEFCLALSDPHGQLSVPPFLLQHGLSLSLFLSLQCQLHLKFSLEQHTFPQINNTHTQISTPLAFATPVPSFCSNSRDTSKQMDAGGDADSNEHIFELRAMNCGGPKKNPNEADTIPI